ncbi:hypothetical protein EDB85DRAFT_2146801 [Lactarius pseudohatsudake]|nr:hypothetical protein EDB85DRAFT_2146801 [Lactarius pseudohatsudake]
MPSPSIAPVLSAQAIHPTDRRPGTPQIARIGTQGHQTTPILIEAEMHFAAPGVQEQAHPALSQATAGTPQPLAVVRPRQNSAIGISAAEGLRRLADRYVNNPASLVSVVRLEPGPSGGFQVMIILGMADLL